MGLLDWFIGSAITRRLDALEAQGRQIMVTLEDVTQKLNDINAAIASERAEVQGLLGELRAEIKRLSDLLAAGQIVTQEQLDGLDAAAAAIVARVRDISEPLATES